MERMLLAAAGSMAVVALFAAPAQARNWQGGSGRSGSSSMHGDWRHHDGVSACFDRNHCDRRRDRRGQTDVVMDWYGGEWAEYNNRSWAPDSYNDWWHEEPWRAYPAWMSRNQDCARPWFSGDTLRC